MTTEEIRLRIMQSGSVSVFTSDEDVYTAVITVDTAKKQGHAVCYDEIFGEGKKFVAAHVLHYRSCVKCKEERNVN